MVLTAQVLRDTVERVVALALVADGATERNVGGLARDNLAILIHVGNGDLNRGVVLGLDEAAGGSTLARHVKINKLSLLR